MRKDQSYRRVGIGALDLHRIGSGAAAQRIYLRTNASRANRSAWGEIEFAERLIEALRALGCDAALLYRGEVPEPSDGPTALVQILGPHLEEPIAGIANLVWITSAPNFAPLGMLARYQTVFCGSEHLTQILQSHQIAARYLPQVTDAAHFHPSKRREGAPELPLVFVGGYEPSADGHIIVDAVRAGFEPQIWGPGWKGIVPARLWRGESLSYDALAEVYASARVVLNSPTKSMARLGFMTNRSYDALASGAYVVSTRLRDFQQPDLPQIRQVDRPETLIAAIRQILEAPAATMDQRLALHERLAQSHGFAPRAAAILAQVRRLFADGAQAPRAFVPDRALGFDAMVPETDDQDNTASLLAAAGEILTTARWLEGADAQVTAADGEIVHALSDDLAQIRQIAQEGRGGAQTHQLTLDRIASRARRLMEAVQPEAITPQFLAAPLPIRPRLLARILRNEPIWPHDPEGFSRDTGKVGLALRPRNEAPSLKRPVGVFLHLYYDELAPDFAARLAHITVPYRLYVSTDTETKAEAIRAALPMALVRVMQNRGRDIWPKLYGFRDVYAAHDFVLHLHGKRSLHSGSLDEWLAHILQCLIGSAAEVNRILSFFLSVPKLGMIVPVPFRVVLSAAHWGANRDIAQELARRMRLAAPLPEDDALRFPVGSMFWARTDAIHPLLDLNLPQTAFPLEAGQVDGTVAHAIERILGVTCRATGHHILPVYGADSRLHRKHQRPFTSNRDLRDMLERGDFDEG